MDWFFNRPIDGDPTIIKKRPTLSNSNQTQNRRRYVNFENGSHFICSFNLNNPESTVCIAFRLNSIASGNNLLLNGIIGNSIKYVAFFETHSGLGLLISRAYNGSYMTVADDDSSFIINGITYSKINYRTFSISFIPPISLFFKDMKNLTHPFHSK